MTFPARLYREAPNVDRFPISPVELVLPPSRLDQEDRNSFNNHHLLWTRAAMARFVLSQTCRDLAMHQVVLPRDTHMLYHQLYDPVPMPSAHDMMARVDDAYFGGLNLRYGGITHPRFQLINDELFKLCKEEYDKGYE